MINSHNVAALIGADVVDPDGDKIGKVGQIFVDPATGQATWATVKSGLFGTAETFVPLDQATAESEMVRLPYGKAFIKNAPHVDTDGELSEVEQQKLYSYYRQEGRAPESPDQAGVRSARHVATDRPVDGGADEPSP